jgi:ABC-2 type transport system permease protein
VKLLRLSWAIFAMSLKADLAHRSNLLFQVLLSLAAAVTSLFTVRIIFSRTDHLGGWTYHEAVILFGTFTILGGILHTFVEPNVLWFHQRVVAGQLDEVLVKPAPSLFLVSLGRHAPLGLAQTGIGAAIVAWGISPSGDAFPVWRGFTWLTLLAVAAVLTWVTRVLIALITLWVPGLTLDVVYDGAWQFGRYPVTMYRQPARFVLTWVLPVAFITTVPARALTRGVSLQLLGASLGIGLVAVVVLRLVWTSGLRRYTSATS